MAVTLWKAEYHHLAFLAEVMGSQSSIRFCFATSMSDLASAILFSESDQNKTQEWENGVVGTEHRGVMFYITFMGMRQGQK